MKFFLNLLLLFLCVPVIAEEKPNFVLIFIDDMGYGDIEPFGSKLNSTPNLNRMAAEGMKLTSFYAAPVCSASRAQILTGSYAPRVSVPGVFFPRQGAGLNPDEVTIAEYLKRAGYATGCIGKWHLGDQQDFLPTRQGFDTYFGIPYSNDMQRKSTRTGKKVTPLLRDEIVAELLEDEGQRRVTREYTEEAVNYINTNKDNPFFLYLPHTAMHVPLFPHEDFAGKSRNGIYGDWVSEVDWSVGQILDAIQEAGISENTLVIFTSDNGPWASKGKAGGVAGPFRGSKGSTLEGGVRVPMIARWPGKIAPGSESSAITGTTDILPTFAALAGVELDKQKQIDGFDISGILQGETEELDREWYYFGGTKLQAIRKGPWKLAVDSQRIGMGFNIIHRDLKKGGRLYNLQNEPGEKTDVSTSHPEIVKKLLAMANTKAAEVQANRRPAGHVEKPVMLYPSDAPIYGKIVEKYSGLLTWSKVKPGQVVATSVAPAVAGKPFTITAKVSGENISGPILAHGGSATGYVLYAKAGKLVFAVSHGTKVYRVTLPATDLSLPFVAEMKEKSISLSQGERMVASPAVPLKRHPQEDLCVGHDDKNAVDSQAPKGRFTGRIESIRVSLQDESSTSDAQ